MTERRQSSAQLRERADATPRQATELEAFEREQRIERFAQRDLMIVLGVVLWTLTLIGGVLTFSLASDVKLYADPLLKPLRFVVLAACLVGIAGIPGVVRRLDDRRTITALTGITLLMVFTHYLLSLYGNGALGGLYIAQIAVTVYAALFLGARGTVSVVALATVLAALSVQQNYYNPDTPNLLSQITLMTIVNWAVAFSIYMLVQNRDRVLHHAERVAYADPLTDLANIRLLRLRAQPLFDPRNIRLHGRTGLIVLDIDGFRTINTLNGRSHGDHMLRTVAATMRGMTTRDEFVARTGSDEFSVLVPDASTQMLERRARRYHEAVIAALTDVIDETTVINVSVAKTLSGGDLRTLEDLLDRADRLLYIEKMSGDSSGGVRGSGRSEEDAASEPPRRRGRPDSSGRWAKLAWSSRPVETRYSTITALIWSIAVGLSMAMPDAVEHDQQLIEVVVAVGFLSSGLRYIGLPATTTARQVFEVLGATAGLVFTVYATGKSASPAIPIELLILIFIGWFVTPRLILPLSAVSLLIVFSALMLWPSGEPALADLVGIFGGSVFAIALVLLLWLIHRDVDRAHRLTTQLAELDTRTGIYNRRTFERRMAEELDRLSYGDREALAVVMIDLGGLKPMTAEHGRTASNRWLSAVGDALITASRDEDCVARLGGDEFAVAAPGVDAESARALTQRLLAATHGAIAELDQSVDGEFSPSAGFALYGMHGRTTEELVAAANIALVSAKVSGRSPERISSFVVAL